MIDKIADQILGIIYLIGWILLSITIMPIVLLFLLMLGVLIIIDYIISFFYR